MDERPLQAAQVAREIGTTPATLRRWVSRGLIPQFDGGWTPAAVAHGRLVARPKGFSDVTELLVARVGAQ